ncbi:DedA family protein [Secundilactobacillus kimchicus]|uniref:Alkaline phosphatase n=2 Tax=Secundilactobacillus kimchicus TaxID=528209 RepID=A0A0R1HW00_9LACO|nr:DedA family protein [Secundilactobacillus kimchicus]KRK47634.1 alkaline phosphatase [Secundilactobacillus kimchicus JCM 15530]
MANATIMTLINTYGYLAVFALIAFENIFPPIPSEIILTFTGFLTIGSSMTVLGAIIAATLGSVLGAGLLYGVGRLIDTTRLERLLNTRFGRLTRIKPQHITKATDFFNRYGGQAVFFGRFVPIVRSLISVPAGMAHYSFSRFLGLSTLGTLLWNAVLISAGFLAGDHWQGILATIESVSDLVLISSLLMLSGFSFWLYRKKKIVK